MDNFFSFIQKPLITFGESSITLMQIGTVVVFILTALLLLRWSFRLLIRYLSRKHLTPDLVQVISRAYMIVALITLFLALLSMLNIPLAAFTFISGAVAIGVGFGAQNIINNFISGWILMWERPIRIGDFLEIGDLRGTVEAINTRSTRIRRVDGVHILLPNSHLLENMVVNWTLVDKLTRCKVRVGVAYGSPVKKVVELMRQAGEEHHAALNEPAPTVIFEDFGDNALIFDLAIWINANVERDLNLVRSDLRFRIEELFNEHGLVIAFPQRDVHIDGAITVMRKEVEALQSSKGSQP
ncbi:Potassium efflux system KefA protein / Small-conductance mechanosensitive channel [gamma proteobacterium IMCC2047]|nr:Potassium efflux system KefA protein / Small-conductance mechanosensitive channel [gamma proteobacterium IMCC2047]